MSSNGYDKISRNMFRMVLVDNSFIESSRIISVFIACHQKKKRFIVSHASRTFIYARVLPSKMHNQCRFTRIDCSFIAIRKICCNENDSELAIKSHFTQIVANTFRFCWYTYKRFIDWSLNSVRAYYHMKKYTSDEQCEKLVHWINLQEFP